jgi:hypothetical protein
MAGSKVVLVGDPQQLQAIEAGAAFRAIHERHGGVEISEVRRQQEAWQQDANRQLSTGHVGQAIRAYEERGMVHAAGTREQARNDLIDTWDRGRKAHRTDSRIILTHTNEEVRALNLLARQRMREDRALGEDAVATTERGERSFASGDRILFLRNERGLGVKNGTLGTVELASARGLAVRTEDGRAIAFDLKDYASLDYGYAATIHKAQGMTVKHTHVLATPGMDSHGAYVALSRHRESVTLHYGRDDFAERSKLVHALSRECGKDMVGYYQPEKTFARLRGLSWRERVMDIARQVPERDKSIFAGFRPSQRPLEPVPSLPRELADQRRTIERYARALQDIGEVRALGVPVLPHQRAALEKAGAALDAIVPHGAADLAKALERHPALVAQAANGRSLDALSAMHREAEVRTEPALRAERFVSDWQGLSAAKAKVEQQGDRDGARHVSA